MKRERVPSLNQSHSESDCLNFIPSNLKGWDYYGWMGDNLLLNMKWYFFLKKKTRKKCESEMKKAKTWTQCMMRYTGTRIYSAQINITKFNAKGHLNVKKVVLITDMHKHVLRINVCLLHTHTHTLHVSDSLINWFCNLHFFSVADICLLMQMTFATRLQSPFNRRAVKSIYELATSSRIILFSFP